MTGGTFRESTTEIAISNETAQSVAERALSTVRKLFDGNGTEPSLIKLTGHKINIQKVKAQLAFALTAQTEDSALPGRHPGEVCESGADAQNKIDGYLMSLKEDAAFHSSLQQKLQTRPDFGFGINQDKPMRLTNYQRSFTWYEDCGSCRGKGRQECPQCHGQRKEQCQFCHGSTQVQCQHCQGSGRQQQNNKDIQCITCHGRGQTNCRNCQNTGKLPCRKCNAQGSNPCGNCHSHGVHTKVRQMITAVTGQFSFDQESVPKAVAAMLSKRPDQMVEKKMIDVKFGEFHRDRTNGQLCMDYDIQAPIGHIALTVNQKPLKIGIFGHTAKIVKGPPFLEPYIQKGMESLKRAATGKGTISGNLQKAGTYKILALAIISSLRMPGRKVAMLLKSKYPAGLQPKTIQTIAKMAGTATDDLTRRPKFIGLVGGIIASTLLLTLLYPIGVRKSMDSKLPIETFGIILDVGIFAGTFFLCLWAAKFYARQAIQQTIGPMMRTLNYAGNMPVPRAGDIVYIALTASVVLFLIMLELSVHIGPNTPAWYASLRHIE